MNLTLRQLRLVDAIARLSRLTAAAEEQAISQSAASQSLKELERQLGYALFEKQGRQLVLTEAGQSALPRIREILAGVTGLQHPKTDFIGGPLRVAASETIGSYLMPRILADFVRRYPKVEPVLEIQNTETVVQQVVKGQVSLGLVEGPVSSSEVSTQFWRLDRLEVFAEPSHHWAHQKRVPANELPTLPWIVREAGSGTRSVFDHAFIQRGQMPRIQLSLTRQEAIKQTVRAGLGIGCLSELALRDEVEHGQLAILQTELQLTRPFSVIQLSRTVPSTLTESFLRFLMNWSD